MKKAERTQVVIDETTIYEIDLDCVECRERKDNKYSVPQKKEAKSLPPKRDPV